MTADNKNGMGEGGQSFKFDVADLDLLEKGVSRFQKPSPPLRRAMITALRTGRSKGEDDGDGLGINKKFNNLLSCADSSDPFQE